MSYYKAMFSPIQIGSVTIPNRFAVPPMGNNFANTDGTLSQRSLSYYGARAKRRVRPDHHRIHRGLQRGKRRPQKALSV